jgi:hypothetical protein
MPAIFDAATDLCRGGRQAGAARGIDAVTFNVDAHDNTSTRKMLDRLLAGDPAIRCQVMRDVTHEPADVVGRERTHVDRGFGSR